jgi:hypothetical protein
MRRVITQIVVTIKAYHYYLLHTKFYTTVFSQVQLHRQTELLVIISIDFDRSDVLHLLGIKKKLQYSGAGHHLFIAFVKACDSVMREVSYIILIEWCLGEIN